jgi:nicotinamidase-related amidase
MSSARFLGTPDLAAWLRAAGLERIALCGIQTNHCVEPTDGDVLTAEQITQASLTSLHEEFATIVRTSDLA